jgi:hypothetical protein
MPKSSAKAKTREAIVATGGEEAGIAPDVAADLAPAPAVDLAVVTLADGAIRYDAPLGAGLDDGDVVEAYAGDYLLGSAAFAAEGGGLSARLSLHAAPRLEFPTELRAVLTRTSQEIAPALALRDAAALMQAAGPPRIKAELTAVGDRAASFELTVETLPEYPRELAFHVNGTDTGRATSRLAAFDGHPACISHEVTFTLRSLLRDGAYVEITDLATGAGIYASSITWMNIMGPVLTSVRRLQARYDALSSLFERAQSRMDALANISRDRQLLDRLDLFYFMINDRVDREVKWLAQRFDPALSEAALTERLAPPEPAPTRRTPHEIDGVGFHEVETDGQGVWRWFGPDVTVFLKDVSPRASALLLQFGAVGAGVKFTDMTGSINGFSILPEFGTSPEGYQEATLPIAPGSLRSDRAIILNLSFKQAYRAPGDVRALSAAFVAAQLLSA